LQDDSKDSRMRGDVLLFWDAMIFRNNFERWLQKIVETSHAMPYDAFARLMQPPASATHPIVGANLLRTLISLSSFDEISLLFETTRQHFRPRNVVWNAERAWATLSSFWCNLPGLG
jgi:hypothetical protein